jgi:hypothetical protein
VYASNIGSWSTPTNSGSNIVAAYSTALLGTGRIAGLNGRAFSNDERSSDFINVAVTRLGTRLQVNIDDTVPLFPIRIMTVSEIPKVAYQLSTGQWGIFPFVKIMPCYKSDGSLIGGGVIFRNGTNRRKYITIQNGYVTDASNTYALELA